MEQPELLTVAQAAEVAGYSKAWMYMLIASGMLPAKKVGEFILLDKATFVSFLATYKPTIGRPRKMGTSSPQDGNTIA